MTRIMTRTERKALPRGGMKPTVFYDKQRKRRPTEERRKKSCEKVKITMCCKECGHEKTMTVGKNFNPRSSSGFRTRCKGTCFTGPTGSVFKFVCFDEKKTAEVKAV